MYLVVWERLYEYPIRPEAAGQVSNKEEAFADKGINLKNVDKLTLGLGTGGNMTAPGGSGKMYFDDIRLNRPKPAP